MNVYRIFRNPPLFVTMIKGLGKGIKISKQSYIIPINGVFPDPKTGDELQKNWEKYWETKLLLKEKEPIFIKIEGKIISISFNTTIRNDGIIEVLVK